MKSRHAYQYVVVSPAAMTDEQIEQFDKEMVREKWGARLHEAMNRSRSSTPIEHQIPDSLWDFVTAYADYRKAGPYSYRDDAAVKNDRFDKRNRAEALGDAAFKAVKKCPGFDKRSAKQCLRLCAQDVDVVISNIKGHEQVIAH